MSYLESHAEDGKSSDDENYEDASTIDNEKIVGDLIKTHLNLNDSDENRINQNNSDDKQFDDKTTDENFLDCESEIDDDSQRDLEKDFSEEEILANKLKSEECKNEGNTAFKEGQFEKSIELYTCGLKLCPVVCETERAVLYGNRAAAKIKMEAVQPAIEDCDRALKFNPNYIKALLRRAKLYEDTDKLDECLEDYKKIAELDPNNLDAKEALNRLPPKIAERNEKLKTEMMGKLKDLGNLFLKPFGLSTNNFQMQQDPETGSYSINLKN